MIRTDGVYILSFSSAESCNSYDLSINLKTGYYQIESFFGYLKYEGWLHSELKGCTDEELNNYALNITDLYYEWSNKVNS